MSIRSNIIIFILITTILFVSFFIVIFFKDYYSFNEVQISMENRKQAEEKSGYLTEEISEKIETVDGIIQALSILLLTQNDSESRTIEQWVADNQDVQGIYYINDEGKTFIFPEDLTASSGLQEINWYEGARAQGESLYIRTYKDQANDTSRILFAQSIHQDDVFEGVIGIEYRLEYLLDTFKGYLTHDFSSFVVYNDEDILYTSTQDQSIGPKMTANQVLSMQESSNRVINQTLDKVDFSIKAILKEPEIWVVNKYFNIELMIAAILYLVMIMVFLRKTLQIYLDPFNRLKLYVLEIKKGNYDINRHYYQNDEFHNLYAAFMKLCQYMKRNIIQINELKDLLSIKYEEINEKNHKLEIQYKRIDQSREDIKNQIEVYSDIVESITDMIWEIDGNGCFIKVNQSFIEQMGYAREEIIGHPVYDFIQNYLTGSRLIEMLKRKDYESVDFVFVPKSGENKLYQTKLFRILDINGEVKEIQALSVDRSHGSDKHGELEHRSRELSILGELSHEILIKQTAEEIVYSFVNRLKALLQIEAIGVKLYKEEQLTDIDIPGTERNMIDLDVIGIPHANEEAVLKGGKIVVMESPADLLHHDPLLEAYLEGKGSILYVPLKGETGFIGIVTIATSEELIKTRLGLIESMSIKIAMAINNRLIFEKLGKNYINTVNVLNAIIRAKSTKYYNKSLAVSKIARFIGKGLFLKEQEITDLGIVSLIKDIGIIGLPDYLLSREVTEMSAEELKQLEQLSEISYRIVSPLGYDQRILNSVRARYNLCDCGDLRKTNFEKIICFSNYLENEIRVHTLEGSEEIKAFFARAKNNMRDHNCIEYLDVFLRAMLTNPDAVNELIDSIQRGGQL